VTSLSLLFAADSGVPDRLPVFPNFKCCVMFLFKELGFMSTVSNKMVVVWYYSSMQPQVLIFPVVTLLVKL
jgi:hypothetical protein